MHDPHRPSRLDEFTVIFEFELSLMPINSMQPHGRTEYCTWINPIHSHLSTLHHHHATPQEAAPLTPPNTPDNAQQGQQPQHDIPYHGDYAGATWNAQGLFHCKADKQGKKWGKINSMLRHCDFLLITETQHTWQNGRG